MILLKFFAMLLAISARETGTVFGDFADSDDTHRRVRKLIKERFGRFILDLKQRQIQVSVNQLLSNRKQIFAVRLLLARRAAHLPTCIFRFGDLKLFCKHILKTRIMATFKSIRQTTLPSITEPLSEAARFWKTNLNPATVYKELSAINWIDINPRGEILTTSSTRISLYEAANLQVKRSFSTSNHTLLYSGTFRQDNAKIFASGSSDGVVRVWDVKKSKPLRLLGTSEKSKSQKHTAAVHRVNFNGINQLFTCGDDKVIKLWDITEDSVLRSFGEGNTHDDYIRASCLVECMSSFVSGSYDHTVKVWDHRAPQNCTFQFNHGSPVESVTSRDFTVISAGETSIKVFDLVAGKVVKTIENAHHKTITCVQNKDNYLLSASIDGYLKVFDINLNVAASFSYVPSQLLSCCFNGFSLAVGASDGILSVNRIKGISKAQKMTNVSDEDAADEFFFDSIPLSRKKPKLNVGQSLVVNANKKHKTLDKHEELLRKFKHTTALNRVFRIHAKSDPQIVINFMQELIRRSALKSALAGRPDKQLKFIIAFLTQHLSDPRFSRILIDVSLALVEVYTSQINRSKEIQTVFMHLSKTLANEISVLTEMTKISGQLQLLMNSQVNIAL